MIAAPLSVSKVTCLDSKLNGPPSYGSSLSVEHIAGELDGLRLMGWEEGAPTGPCWVGLSSPPTLYLLLAHTAPRKPFPCREGQTSIPAGTTCAVAIATQAPCPVILLEVTAPQSKGGRQSALPSPWAAVGWGPCRALLSGSLSSSFPQRCRINVSEQKRSLLGALDLALPQIPHGCH